MSTLATNADLASTCFQPRMVIARVAFASDQDLWLRTLAVAGSIVRRNVDVEGAYRLALCTSPQVAPLPAGPSTADSRE